MAKKPAWCLIDCLVLLGIALAACMPGAELTSTASTLPIASPSPACTAIGQIWTAPGDGMTLVCVPAGSFTMGSEEAGAYDDHKPVRVVTLAAYWIDRSEVTNAQYAACVRAGACSAPQETKSSAGRVITTVSIFTG